MDNQPHHDDYIPPGSSEKNTTFTVTTPLPKVRIAIALGVLLLVAAGAHLYLAGYLTAPAPGAVTEPIDPNAGIERRELTHSFISGAGAFDLSAEATALTENLDADLTAYATATITPATPRAFTEVLYGDAPGIMYVTTDTYPLLSTFLDRAYIDMELATTDLNLRYLADATPPHLRSEDVTLTDNTYGYTFPPLPATEAILLGEILAWLDPENATTYQAAPTLFLEGLTAEGKVLSGDIAAAQALVTQYLTVLEANDVVMQQWYPQLQAELQAASAAVE